MKRNYNLPMEPGTWYIWVGGSCDYGHEERASAGAYLIQQDNRTTGQWVTSAFHTTEFRMILTAMIRAMEILPEGSKLVFLTNVAYIQQNFDKAPTTDTVNGDLIARCIELQSRHKQVNVCLVPYHKYPQLPQTHDMAHQAMMELRKRLD